MVLSPYILGITLYESDGSTPRSGATVVITNDRTEETQTGTTNSSGQCVFDLANFSQGYVEGDTITVEKQVAHSEMEYFVAANGEETAPSWVEVENETKVRIYPNSTRIKLNTTRYPGGKSVNFTLD